MSQRTSAKAACPSMTGETEWEMRRTWAMTTRAVKVPKRAVRRIGRLALRAYFKRRGSNGRTTPIVPKTWALNELNPAFSPRL